MAVHEEGDTEDRMELSELNARIQSLVSAKVGADVCTPLNTLLGWRRCVSRPALLEMQQAGSDNMVHLKRIAEEMQKEVAAVGAVHAKENNNDVPKLVPGESFEEVT